MGLISLLVPAWAGPGTEAWAAPPTSEPLRPAGPPPAEGEPLFERVDAERSGVQFVNPLDTAHPLKRLYHGGFAAGGVAVGDVDGEGRPDLFFVSGPSRNRLFLNRGGFRFEEGTAEAGAAGAVDGGDNWGAGAAMVDIEGDGDLDIYVCNYGSPNQLLVNDGRGRFADAAVEAGLAVADASLMATFCDYDNDGDLDCYLLTYRLYREGGWPRDRHEFVGGVPRIRKPYERFYQVVEAGRGADGKRQYSIEYAGRPDRLLRNDGAPPDRPGGVPRFTDVSAAAGISGRGHGLSATWWDYDGDGWMDLYVGNDFNDPDRLYRNRGDGTFEDVIREAVPHTSWYSMGADAGDLDGDGRPDLLSADMSGRTHFTQKTAMGSMSANRWFLESAEPRQYMRNALFLNTGTARFIEAAYLAGLADTDWTWAVKIADLDHDGRNDVFFTNGSSRNFTDSDRLLAPGALIGKTQWDLWEDQPPRPERNLAYRNQGDLRFGEVGAAWGLDHLGISYAAAAGDLDGDGDLDLAVVNLDEKAHLYRNRSPASARRLVLRLRGTRGSNRFGVGATVELRTGSGPAQTRTLVPARGFLGSDEPAVFFGLGGAAEAGEVTVRWPGGQVQPLGPLAAGRVYTVTEPATVAQEAAAAARPAPLYQPYELPRGMAHREVPFDDFARQPLLPQRLSQLGPGLAWGDIDGDGDDDAFLGGAAGHAGRLFINRGGGAFHRRFSRALIEDKAAEDMAPLFLDADRDGDLDLFVVSGGVECEPGDAVLRDRLYLNDGAGAFTAAPAGALPDLRDSGGPAAAVDFDRDGDLDLVVGGRSIPGRYPLPPVSRLLRNDSGGPPRGNKAGGAAAPAPRFTDVTDALAPGLGSAGMVTGALWSDADNDGWPDLFLTVEWGPVKFFRNRGGRLEDATDAAGLSARSGWWNGIVGADIDGDGDIDYAVTNLGLNTKYHASPGQPALLYGGDFGGDGTLRLVEAEHEAGTLYPLRGRSCSTSAIPSLAPRFTSYRAFALATLEEIYPPELLGSARRFAADTFESGILINDGAARFRFQPLPRLAQVSPGFGAAFTDADADGRPDLVLAQNFFGPQVETGRMDGGVGLLLRGRGDGAFEPLRPVESGLVVPGDATALTVIDLDRDGHPGLVVAINDGAALAFERHPPAGAPRPLTVRLRGPPGNPAAAGARVKVTLADGSRQTAEIYAGGGYLSQQPGALTFYPGGAARFVSVEVLWPGPGARRSEHRLEESEAAGRGGGVVLGYPNDADG